MSTDNELMEVAWLIEFEIEGEPRRSVHLHNCIADYREIDPKARSSVLTSHATALASIQSLQAELEAARKNAERYRWLRSGGNDGVYVWDQRGEKFQECGSLLAGEALDAAIDATRACQGANCNSTDGLTHSSECLDETDAAFGAMESKRAV